VKIDELEIHYAEDGSQDGWPVVLSHGSQYSSEAFTEVAPLLTFEGARVRIPYLRVFSPTRFLSEDTPRTGQQAALALDMVDFIDALSFRKSILVGFD
jgi:pimeloyl-ACP methyl ester carboxylesterase